MRALSVLVLALLLSACGGTRDQSPVTIYFDNAFAAPGTLRDLLTQGMDQSTPGTTLTLRVGASPRPTVDITGFTGVRQSAAVELLLPVSRRLMALDGGAIEPVSNGSDVTGWSLRW